MLRHKMVVLAVGAQCAFERGGDLFATIMKMVGQRDPCPDTLGAGVHAESVGPLFFFFLLLGHKSPASYPMQTAMYPVLHARSKQVVKILSQCHHAS